MHDSRMSSTNPTSRLSARTALTILLVACTVPAAFAPAAFAAEGATVAGTFTANGEEVALPHAYIWPADEGFYDAADPTWTLLFVDREVETRDLGGMVWDAAFLEVGLTITSGFDEEPKLQAYSQSIRFSADQGGNVSGGSYPEVELTVENGRAKGRVYQTEMQEFFDDTYQYDLTFDLPISDPNAPIGDPLPAGGGAPGKAYKDWSAAVHAGDLEKMKALLPPEASADLASATDEEIKDQIEFMQMMTPKDIEILDGSTDGSTAIMNIKGTMEGEEVKFEVTMTKMGDFWVPTGSKM